MIESVRLSWVSIALIVIACGFLFSLLAGRRSSCKSGAAKFFGVICIFLALAALFVVNRSHYQGQRVTYEEVAPFSEPAPQPSIQQADDQFTVQRGRNATACRAVFLPPDEEGNTQVLVEMTLAPEWRVLAVGKPRRFSRAATISQLVLAESKSKYSFTDPVQALQQPTVEGLLRFHTDRIIWTAPIQLKRGVDADELQVRGTLHAQLMKSEFPPLVVPVDHSFVATLDSTGEFAIDFLEPAAENDQTGIPVASNNSFTGDTEAASSLNSEPSQTSDSTGTAASTQQQVAHSGTLSAPPSPTQQVTTSSASAPGSMISTSAESIYTSFPFGDPGYDAQLDAEVPYSWIKTASTVKSRDGKAYYTTVATGAYHVDSYDKMRKEFRQKVLERFRDYVDKELLEEGASARLDLNYAFIASHVSEFSEAGESDIDRGDQMRIQYGRIAFTPDVAAKIKGMYKEAVVIHRIGFFGAIGVICLALVGTVYGYFRLDTATKGYYSGRLKLAALVVGLLILAAGSGILEEFGRNGGF
ncbi:MAG: hypothetical protein MPJ50_13800 [Pirellulales bacterium]|nr:hypothetical protein [Pirellulales bacterium]